MMSYMVYVLCMVVVVMAMMNEGVEVAVVIGTCTVKGLNKTHKAIVIVVILVHSAYIHGVVLLGQLC